MSKNSSKTEKTKLLGLIEWGSDTYKELRPLLKGIVSALMRYDLPKMTRIRKDVLKILDGLGRADMSRSSPKIKVNLEREVHAVIDRIYKDKIGIFESVDSGAEELKRMAETIGRARRRRIGERKIKERSVQDCDGIELSKQAKSKLLELQKHFGFNSASEAVVFAVSFCMDKHTKTTDSSVKEKGKNKRWPELEKKITEVRSMGKYPFGE